MLPPSSRGHQFLCKPRSLPTLRTGKPASSWTGKKKMEAVVLTALSNQSQAQEEKRRKKVTFLKKASRETSGLSVSLAGLTCKDVKVQRRTRWKQDENKTL